MRTQPVLVVGGGIVGLSTALFLARRGVAVTVYERGVSRDCAAAGSAGIIAPGHTPLTDPDVFRKLPSLLFDAHSPLHILPRCDPRLAEWLMSFLSACRPKRWREAVASLCDVGLEAGECLQTLVAEERIDCEYRADGWMEAFRDASVMQSSRATADRLHAAGYGVEEIDGHALADREPAFADGLAGAHIFTDGASVDPALLVNGLAAAVRRHGGEVQEHTEVAGIRTSTGRVTGLDLADGRAIDGNRVVLAAGAWTTDLARRIGLRIPMQAGKGYHIDLRGAGPRPTITSVLIEAWTAVTPLGDRLRLAGTVELGGLDETITPGRPDLLPRMATVYLPGLEDWREVERWAGLRPLTADGLPVVGRAPGIEGLWVATGHAMMGLLLGPLSGRLVAEQILGDAPPAKPEGWSPARF